MHGSIKLKRVYEPPDEADGRRVLVDRLWPRGVSKTAAQVDFWLKEIAPSNELRTCFDHDPAKWKAFRARYLQELKGNTRTVAQLEKLVSQGPVTLVYGAKDERFNQAVVLKEFIESARGRTRR